MKQRRRRQFFCFSRILFATVASNSLLVSVFLQLPIPSVVSASASTVFVVVGRRPIQRIMVLGTVLQLFQIGFDKNKAAVGLADAAGTTPSSLKSTTTTTTTHSDNQFAVEGEEVIENVVVEGVALPSSRILSDDGMPLYRNGHGIRSVPFFGMNIKVYVAHLYSRRPLNEEDALALIQSPPMMGTTTATSASSSSAAAAVFGLSNHTTERRDDDYYDAHDHHYRQNPLHFDFTFLRHVGQSRVVSAWTQQLEHSVTHRYEGYEQDRDRFIELFSTGHIENGGTQTVQLVGDETRIIDQGDHKGTIVGRDFQTSFLSMWIGPKAVAEDLKRNLFQGHGRQQEPGSCSAESEIDMTMVKAEQLQTMETKPVAV